MIPGYVATVRKKPLQPYSLVRDVEKKQYIFVPIFDGRDQDDLIDRVVEVQKTRGIDVREQGARDDKDAIERGLIAEGYTQVSHVDLILGPAPWRHRGR